MSARTSFGLVGDELALRCRVLLPPDFEGKIHARSLVTPRAHVDFLIDQRFLVQDGGWPGPAYSQAAT
jgi:hypothetical protein